MGDPAPPIFAFKWLKGDSIGQLKKGIPYVIEFGATWCKPCAAAIPDLTALAQKHRGQAEVISFFVKELNHEPENTKNPKYVDWVKKYIAKKADQIDYHVAVDGPTKIMEKTWINAIGASGVPKIFLIDEEGYIAYIADGYSGRVIKVINDLLASMYNETYDLGKRVEINNERLSKIVKYDKKKLLYIDGNGGDDPDIIFRSVLTRYKGDISAGSSEYVSSFSWFPKELKYLQARVQEIGIPLKKLYYMAYADTTGHWIPSRKKVFGYQFPDTIAMPHFKYSYGKYWYEAILEVTDESPFQYDFRAIYNLWNYSLKVPMEKNTAKLLQQIMRKDLQTYFGYDVYVETRMMPCWFLKAYRGAAKKLAPTRPGSKYMFEKLRDGHWKYYNAEIRDIIHRLSFFGPHVNSDEEAYEAPFVDATEIQSFIDYEITSEEIDHIRNLDFQAVKNYLKKFDLYLEKGQKPMKVVVIRDPKG